MEVILENLSRPGEIHHIKCGEKVRLNIQTRPFQQIMVSNGEHTTVLGNADKQGKFRKEISLSHAEIGSWRQDFFLNDGSDKGSISFNVIGENGETKKEETSGGGILESLFNPSTLLLIAGAGYFLYQDLFGSPKKSKPKVEPLGDSEEELEEPEEENEEDLETEEV